MKVTGLKSYLVSSGAGKNWLFVKVQTDEGLWGWGEAYALRDREHGIEANIKHISRYLIGRNPVNIRHFVQAMYEDWTGRHGSMDYFCAISAVELALWDILGKSLNAPVHRLLGGAYRNKIRVYANGWSTGAETPREYAERAVKVVDAGFKALKFYPFITARHACITREEEDHALEIVKAVRDAVGPKIDIMVDAFRRLSPMCAVRVARRLEEYRLLWFEEPVTPDTPETLAEVRAQTKIPLVAGEALYTRFGFLPFLQKRAVDVINPDVCSCGGLIEMLEIAAMADTYGIAVAPHNFNSNVVGLAATLHAAACMPHFYICEYFTNFQRRSEEISQDVFRLEGDCLTIPDKPGLGVELDEKAMGKFPYIESRREVKLFLGA